MKVTLLTTLLPSFDYIKNVEELLECPKFHTSGQGRGVELCSHRSRKPLVI